METLRCFLGTLVCAYRTPKAGSLLDFRPLLSPKLPMKWMWSGEDSSGIQIWYKGLYWFFFKFLDAGNHSIFTLKFSDRSDWILGFLSFALLLPQLSYWQADDTHREVLEMLRDTELFGHLANQLRAKGFTRNPPNESWFPSKRSRVWLQNFHFLLPWWLKF